MTSGIVSDTSSLLPQRWSKSTAIALSIVPGAGHLYGGRTVQAVGWLFLVPVAYLVLGYLTVSWVADAAPRLAPALAVAIALMPGATVHLFCVRSAASTRAVRSSPPSAVGLLGISLLAPLTGILVGPFFMSRGWRREGLWMLTLSAVLAVAYAVAAWQVLLWLEPFMRRWVESANRYHY